MGRMETPRVEGPNPGANDLELLRKAAAGNARAFAALVEIHGQRLFALAVSLIGNSADAEDVLQETLAGAFRGLGKFQARASVKTWLTRILVTQAAKWRRDRKRQKTQSLNEELASADTELAVDSESTGVDRTIDLQAAIQELSPEHREVLVLREYEQMAYEEMAEALGVPRGTVESRLYRARSALREILKSYLP